MAKNKTEETSKSVAEFIDAVPDELKRSDSHQIIEILKSQSGFEPKMWGPSIIGFGSYHYKYASGHEGDAPILAFSPRATAIVLYLSLNEEKRKYLLPRFGKHKTDKGCIYVKKLSDINTEVLKEMIEVSIKNTQSLYPNN